MPKLLRWKRHVKLRLTHREAETLRSILDQVDGARLGEAEAIAWLKHPTSRQARLTASLLMQMPERFPPP